MAKGWLLQRDLVSTGRLCYQCDWAIIVFGEFLQRQKNTWNAVIPFLTKYLSFHPIPCCKGDEDFSRLPDQQASSARYGCKVKEILWWKFNSNWGGSTILDWKGKLLLCRMYDFHVEGMKVRPWGEKQLILYNQIKCQTKF